MHAGKTVFSQIMSLLPMKQFHRCVERYQDHHKEWIKQHLRIKAFYGASPNAVKVQIWVAVCVYLLLAILKKRLGLQADLHGILQVASVTVFEKIPVLQAFQCLESQPSLLAPANQLNPFD